jgi:hypothetical protein
MDLGTTLKHLFYEKDQLINSLFDCCDDYYIIRGAEHRFTMASVSFMRDLIADAVEENAHEAR